MSEYIKIVCDGCKEPIIDRPTNSIGIMPSKALNKLTLIRSASNSSDSIHSGTYHFCGERCLVNFITVQHK